MRRASSRLYPVVPLLLALLVLPAPGLAEQQLYDVELIVFRHAEATSRQAGERWPRVAEPARHGRYAELSSDGSVDERHYRQLSGDALRLREVAQRLERSDQYEVLVHSAWRQPGLGNSEAAAIPLPLGSSPQSADEPVNGNGGSDLPVVLGPERLPEGLSGYVRVYRERFLHAELDLRYLAGGADGRASLPLFEDQPPVVVMQERRRMRSNELHHLDHPVIGALIRVSPVD